METFEWDRRFVTGIDGVDQQHQHLVQLVNRVGDLMASGEAIPEATLQAIFLELADYARRHFADEEGLMQEVGLDARHVDSHRAHHHQFIQQVAAMWRSRDKMANPAEVVHGFLAAWLSFHILGEDQAMARQMAAIRRGGDAATAFEADQMPADSATAALLQALHRLYGVLSVQNQNLAESNQHLEAKVSERTRELVAANQRLETEQRELTELLAKVEEAQGQLLQSEKMAAIGQLAAGVAHEINNPVGFVNSNLSTLKGYVDRLLEAVTAFEACAIRHQVPPEEVAAVRRDADLDYLRQDVVDLLAESQDGLLRVRKIVQDLRDFSHVDEAEWQEADINAGLDSTLNVVWNEIKYKAEVHKDYGRLPPVRCIPAQLNQVFMNLLVNAAQAIEGHGTISLRTGVDGPWAWVEIEDTGKGMTPVVAQRVFEPFYTTKPVGKGTGLGLSLSYDIVVKRHGGCIEVKRSAPGAGTTFRVTLPVAGSAEAI